MRKKSWSLLLVVFMVLMTGCVENNSNEGDHKGISGKDLEEYNRLAREAFTNGSDVYIK